MITETLFTPFDTLLEEVISEHHETIQDLTGTGVFFISQSTQFPGTSQKYKNYYILIRIENAFGGCCIEEGTLSPDIAPELSGTPLIDLLRHDKRVVRVAALDAFRSYQMLNNPPQRELLMLPASNPHTRAKVRDQGIVEIADIKPGERVALIGVVNPLVEAIETLGAQCLPCDFNMEVTSTGLNVEKDMHKVLVKADKVIATGMTLSNGSFDQILEVCVKRDLPLIIYAQTGASIFPSYLQRGVTAVLAESFPYSQFTAEESKVYLYRT